MRVVSGAMNGSIGRYEKAEEFFEMSGLYIEGSFPVFAESCWLYEAAKPHIKGIFLFPLQTSDFRLQTPRP